MFRSYVYNYRSFYQVHKACQFKNNYLMSTLKQSEINNSVDKICENNKIRKEKESSSISNLERDNSNFELKLKHEHNYVEHQYFKDFKEENKKMSSRFEIPMEEVGRMFGIRF